MRLELKLEELDDRDQDLDQQAESRGAERHLQECTNQKSALKKLLILAAVSEALTGLILLLHPPILTWLLFDSDVAGAGVLMSRLAGIALIALAAACWPDGNLLRAFLGMLTFGVLAMLFLVYVGINGSAGILLWPGVAAHAGISGLLIWAWRKGRQAPEVSK